MPELRPDPWTAGIIKTWLLLTVVVVAAIALAVVVLP